LPGRNVGRYGSLRAEGADAQPRIVADQDTDLAELRRGLIASRTAAPFRPPADADDLELCG
jgi:hypothetical protein